MEAVGKTIEYYKVQMERYQERENETKKNQL